MDPPPAAMAAPPAQLFEFGTPLWLNLHHRLYAESSPRPGKALPLPAEAQPKWDAAVKAYREIFPERETIVALVHHHAEDQRDENEPRLEKPTSMQTSVTVRLAARRRSWARSMRRRVR